MNRRERRREKSLGVAQRNVTRIGYENLAPILLLLLVRSGVLVDRLQMLREQAIGVAETMIVPDVNALVLAGESQVFVRIRAVGTQILEPVADNGLVFRVREQEINF